MTKEEAVQTIGTKPRKPLRSRRRSLSGLVLSHFLASVVLLALAGLLFDGRAALLFAALGTGLLASILIVLSVRLSRPFTPLLIAVMLGSQALWIVALCISGASTLVAETTFQIDLASNPVHAMLPLLIVPAALLTGSLLTVPRRRAGEAPFIAYPIRADLFEIRSYLLLGAVIILLNWFAAQEDSGALGYVIRVLNLAFIFMPFFAGRASVRDPLLLAVWSGCLVTNAAIGMLAGTRFPFFAVALFGIGRAFETGGLFRVANLQKLAVLAVILLACSGVVGIVRQEIGRGGVELVSGERVQTFIDNAVRALSGQSGREASGTAGEAALQRMVAWTNFAVPLLSPAVIPYRGLQGVGPEIVAYAALTAVEGKSRAAVLSEGLYTAPATSYGFSVNETTSVEFGVLPDAWSRGGPLMVASTALLLGIVFALLERALFASHARHPALALLLTIVLYADAWSMYSQPALAVFRRIIIDVMVLGCAFVAMNCVMRVVYFALRRPRRMAR